MPLLANVNNMKKLLPISFGILLGAIVSVGLIYTNLNKASAEDSVSCADGWNDCIAAVETFEWEDVWAPFGHSEAGQDLYVLIYDKLNNRAENDSLKMVASNFGLTTTEAAAVLDGSLFPIFNNPNIGGRTLTQVEAALILNQLQKD